MRNWGYAFASGWTYYCQDRWTCDGITVGCWVAKSSSERTAGKPACTRQRNKKSRRRSHSPHVHRRPPAYLLCFCPKVCSQLSASVLWLVTGASSRGHSKTALETSAGAAAVATVASYPWQVLPNWIHNDIVWVCPCWDSYVTLKLSEDPTLLSLPTFLFPYSCFRSIGHWHIPPTWRQADTHPPAN